MTAGTERPGASAAPKVDAAAVLAERRRVFASGRTRDLDWRREQLAGVVRFLDEGEAEITAALAEDLGRPAVEAWIGDIAVPRTEAEYARRHLRRWARPQRWRMPVSQQPARGWVQYEPLGVVLVIAPWNYPLQLTLAPLVAALAAGNCVVIKPSELAPASAGLLARLLPRYVDPEAVAVVEGDAGTTQQLLAAGFDHAFFTGGPETAKAVMATAARTLTPVTLELGGKSPVVVTADADVDVAARRIALVKLLNAGQTCLAPDYVLADRTVRDRLVERLTKAVADFTADRPDGLPVRGAREAERLAGLLSATKGTVVTGGTTGGATGGRTVRPTVVVDPDPEEPLMRQEIFGPVLPVLAYDDLEEAIDFVVSRPKPLAAYAFTGSREVARTLIDRLPGGAVVINHLGVHSMVPQLPFGGVGASGTGTYHGEWGFRTLSHPKAVLRKPTRPDPSLLYPPYSDRAFRLLRRLL